MVEKKKRLSTYQSSVVVKHSGRKDDDSPSQILLEMWIYTQEEVNASEEQIKSSQ